MKHTVGYGESKLVSECLLGKAAEICGVRSASIITSSQSLGAFPCAFPGRDRIDWLPVDKVSKILLEILHSASSKLSDDLAQTFNVVNPQAGSWGLDIAAVVIPMYPGGGVRAVTMEDWVERLRSSAQEAERIGTFDIERNPAIRLLDFFSAASGSGVEQGPRWLSSSKAEQSSNTLEGLGPITKKWLENWMVQWGITSAHALT